MSSSPQKRNYAAGDKLTLVVTGMDSGGRLFREQVSALIQEGDEYCFFMSRQLRKHDSVLIEFPPDRPGGKVQKIPARVTFAVSYAGPQGGIEIHLRPQASLDKSGPATQESTSVAHLLLASPSAQQDATQEKKHEEHPQPAASVPAASPAPAEQPRVDGPLLDAVRTQTADAVLKELRNKLTADSQILSVELGRKISKELSEHAGKLGQALAGDLQSQMNQVQVRLDEFHKYLDSVWAGCEAALEESQRARVQEFQQKSGALAGEAEERLEKLRITLAEQQLALENHIQQTVWESLKQATAQLEGHVQGVASSVAIRAQDEITAHWSAQEQTLTRRAAGVQMRLQELFDQLEGAVERAEAVLDPVRTVADLAEKHQAEQASRPRGDRPAVALIPVDVGMRRHIQASIVKARTRFRESVAQISQLLESNLGHGNLSATMQEK